ncbi:MAG: magnesium/cobalt transporter CorA [Microthrixaceae bacterium]
MIVGRGVYRDGHKLTSEGDFGELAAAAAGSPDSFVWVGLKNPSDDELQQAAAAFDIHPLAIEDAQATHERPKVDLFGETLTLVLRSAAYDDATESIEIGQITVMSSPGHVLVVRHGEGVPLTDLRSRMESDPEWLAQGPGVVLHAILDTVVEAYLPVAAGIDNDIAEVEEAVFSLGREEPTRRIYELTREVLEFRKSAFPLTGVMETLTRVSHPMITDDIRRYLRDTEDDVKRVVDQIHTERELLDSALEANLAQVGIRQNEDMRKISAWVAIAAVPTMVAGIYGMNFDHMPELNTRYGYFVVLAVVMLACLALYRTFKRSGWL